MLQRSFLWLSCFGIASVAGYSQTSTAPQVFKANARIVVLDVVVTGKGGHPLTGLQKQNFTLQEDGHPQTITYFEEHSPEKSSQSTRPELPPDVFSNIPRVKTSEPVTVLLLDSLNTPLADQAVVRAQTLKYLKTVPRGRRIAIFTLGTQLRFIQGFTDDPALLMAAIDDRKNGVTAQVSPLLQSQSQRAADQEVAAALNEVHAADAAALMRQFFAEQTSIQSGLRLKLTLDAMQQLAYYLAAIPGRKNLVWFSGAFPVVIFPNAGLQNPFGAQRNDQDEVKKTDALLAASQVAVYPIAAEGLATDAIYGADTDARQAQQPVIKPRQEDSQERNANHAAMDQIAKSTGGVAFYNTNGLVDALNRVAEHAAYFYTLTYTSTHTEPDGKFRKIQLHLNPPGYELAYRRGYYADRKSEDKNKLQATVTAPGALASAQPAAGAAPDPLLPFLRPSLPNATQIPVQLHIVRGGAASVTGTPSGDNPSVAAPLTRFSVDFLITARGLEFSPASEDHHRVSIEAALVIYSRDGRPLNWIVRQINLNLDATRYATAQNTGVNFFLQIDAPQDGSFLRGGVYDLNANMVGTLQIPLRTISVAQSVPGSR